MSELKVNKVSPQSGTDFTLGDSGDTFTVPSGATLTVAGTFTQTGTQTFDGGVDIDNFNINGTTITLSSGDMTLDVAGDIVLDADGGEILFHDATTAMGHISMASSNITLKSLVSDKDIIFQGNDGGAGITALTLDMSAAGAATFNNAITSGAVITSGAGLVIADTGNIGSASDTDAIAIAANGVVTFSQTPVLSGASLTAGTTPLTTLDIDGATDIGADIADADLFVVDDGAGGTNRKVAASRLKTYAGVSGDVTTIDSLFKTDIKIGEDDQTKIDFGIANAIQFFANNTEAMRILAGGGVVIGKTSETVDDVGHEFRANGLAVHTRNQDVVLLLNREGNDGDIVDFEGDGTKEGTISVSGNTIAYNTFTGTHWSRLSDNSKPTILRGTVMESLDAMVNWYQLRFTHNGKAERITHVLLDSQSVGDEITYNHNGTDVTATIIREGDIKHVQTKISTTDEAKNVYGVFFDWDNSDGDAGYNDMMIAAVGTYVVRIHKDETVVKGNLLQSNGDGTAKVLAGSTSITADVLSTVFAKVLSNTKIETYADGSFIVPCAFTNC